MALMNPLAVATITLQKINEISLYQSEIISTNGNLFHPYDTETTLVFNVFKDSLRITDSFSDIEWHKFSSDSNLYEEDVLWGEQYRNLSIIKITKNDFKKKCIIQADAYNIINGERVCSTSARITLINVNDLQNNIEPPEDPEEGCLWVDSSGTVPVIKSWNSLLGKWITVGDTKPFVRNLIHNSNFWRLNYDGFTEENYNFLNDMIVVEYDNKQWLRLKTYKATEGAETSAGIFQNTSYPIEKKSFYTLSFLCKRIDNKDYDGRSVYVKIISIDEENYITTLESKSIEVFPDASIVSTTFETIETTNSIQILIGVEPMALSELYITEISLYNTDKYYPWELSPEDTIAQIENKLNNDHESVFNALTRNGTMEGIYTSFDEEGKEHFYFNGTHIKTGSIDGGLINGIGLNIKDENGDSIFHVYRDESGTHIDMHAKNLYIGPNKKEATTTDYVDSIKTDTLEYTSNQLQANKEELENKIDNDIKSSSESLTTDITNYIDNSLNVVKTETSIEISQSKEQSIAQSKSYIDDNLFLTIVETEKLIDEKDAINLQIAKDYADNIFKKAESSIDNKVDDLISEQSDLRKVISAEIDNDISISENNTYNYIDNKYLIFQQKLNDKVDREDLASTYATKDYVTTKISEAQLESDGDGSSIDLSDFALKSEIPTKTSQLNNDSNYLTSIPSEYITETELNSKGYITDISNKADKNHSHDNYALKTEVPTKTSQLDNDSNYLTSIPNEYATKDYVTTKISEAQLESDENDSPIDLSGFALKSEIPTKVSQLDNDNNYLTSIPNEYITETELNSKGYITDVSNKADKNHSHDNYALKTEVPTKVSQLSNDNNYLTSIPSEYATKDYVTTKISEAQLESDGDGSSIDLSSFALKTDVPTKVSQLDNDSNYLTSIPSEYITETELNSKGYITDVSDKADKNHSHDDYALKIEIPTKISQLTNDSNYLTSIPSEYITETELNSKGYITDVSNKADKNHSHDDYALKSETPTKVSQLSNDSNYLTSIPSEYVTETELNSKGYITDVSDKADKNHSHDNYALKTEVPTKVSQLDNDSNYLTSIPSEYITENLLKEELKNHIKTVEMYGAIGDGEADDTVAIKNAINSLKNIGGVLYFSKTRYKISETIYIPQGITLIGLSANKYTQEYSGSNLLSDGGTIIQPSGDFDVFVFEKAASYSGIKNMAIHYPGVNFLSTSTSSTSCAIKFSIATIDAEYTENVVLENLDICGFQCAICMPWIKGESFNYAQYYYTTFRNISIMKCNCGVFLNGMSDIILDNIFCKDLFGMDLSKINSYTAPIINNIDWASSVWTEKSMNLINDLGNSVINKFAVYGGSGHGMILQDCVSIHFDRAIFASLNDYAGLVILGCNNKSRIYGLRSALNKYGIIIDKSTNCYSSRIDFISCRIENNYNHGIYVKFGKDITFSQCDISSNSLNNTGLYDGVYAEDSNNLLFNACFLGDEQAQPTQQYCFNGCAGLTCRFLGCDFTGCDKSMNITYGEIQHVLSAGFKE